MDFLPPHSGDSSDVSQRRLRAEDSVDLSLVRRCRAVRAIRRRAAKVWNTSHYASAIHKFARVVSQCGRMGAVVSSRLRDVSNWPAGRCTVGVAAGAGPCSVGSQRKLGQRFLALGDTAASCCARADNSAAGCGVGFIALIRRVYSQALAVAVRCRPDQLNKSFR